MANYGGTVAAPTLGFRDANNVLIDPAVVQLKYKPPNSSLITLVFGVDPIVKDAVGLYHFDVGTTGQAGIWEYEWVSPDQTLAPNSFQVLTAPL